jgi:4-carboxymuconolactone decarboxylase
MKPLYTVLFGCFFLLSCESTFAQASTERFARITTENMSADQRKYFNDLMSGPVSATGSAAVVKGSNSLGAPFNIWLRSPKLAESFRVVSEQIRFNSSLPLKLNEFAILITAQKWSSPYEWYAHHRLALKAGLDPRIADQLAQGIKPQGMGNEEEAIYDFVAELLATNQVGDRNFIKVKNLFGEQGVVDLIATTGYYVLVAMALNVNRTPLPSGAQYTIQAPKETQ